LHGEIRGLFLQRFPYNHRQAPVRAMALIRDAVQRLHQLGDLGHRVVRRHARAGVPENGGDRFFPNVGLAQRAVLRDLLERHL